MKKLLSFVFFFCSCSSLFSLSEEKVDAVILGGGIGGLTSSIYLARSGLKALVIEGPVPGGAITQSERIQNWPGELDISGSDLIEKVRNQAIKNGVILSSEEVIKAEVSSSPFSFIVQDVYDPSKQRKIVADVCIIAMGSKARRLNVEGEQKYWSKGVYTCAVCDGSLYKDKVVSVVGGGDAAVLEADYLSRIASKVYVLVRGNRLKGVERQRAEELLANPKVEVIYQTRVSAIKGDESSVRKIEIVSQGAEKQEIAVDAVFLAVGSIPNTHLFASQIELDEKGYIKQKNFFETSVPRLFAIGDIADSIFQQAISAAGDGAKAAIQANKAFPRKQIIEVSLPIQEVKNKKETSIPAGGVLEIKSLRHLKEILAASSTPVVVDFYAPWCGPCKRLGGFLDGWAKDLYGKVIICKVNIDADSTREIAALYKVQAVPTFIEMDGKGGEVGRQVGTQDIVRYINHLK